MSTKKLGSIIKSPNDALKLTNSLIDILILQIIVVVSIEAFQRICNSRRDKERIILTYCQRLCKKPTLLVD